MDEEKREAEQKQEKAAASEKAPKDKNLFDMAREIEAKERYEAELREREQQKQETEAAYQAREAYGEQLEEEKRELLRHKQGIITDSDTIFEQQAEKKRYTKRERFSNFLYHNKWWLGFAAFFVLIGGYLTYDYLTTEEPDMIILVLVEDERLNQQSDVLAAYAEQYITDFNDDGEVLVSVHYIPISNEESYGTSYYQSNVTKLTVEFQSADAMLVIASEGAAEAIAPETTLMELESLFPDSEQVDAYGYYLADTSFSDRIGYTGTLGKDVYLGIRMPQRLMYCTQDEMQAAYDEAFPLLQRMISDFSETYTAPAETTE